MCGQGCCPNSGASNQLLIGLSGVLLSACLHTQEAGNVATLWVVYKLRLFSRIQDGKGRRYLVHLSAHEKPAV